jgi:type IV pilus assembly protein PilC
MPKFEFKAFTQEGKLKEGVISAESREKALQILQEQNLFVSSLVIAKSKEKVFLSKPRLKDLYFFTKQLSYLLKAKTPLDESIKTLSESTSNHYFRSVLMEIYNDLVSGISFSNSLSRFSDVFNSYYLGMIKVGETVGSLDEVLDYLAGHLNNQLRLKGRIIQVSIYPLMVLILFLGILIALFYFIVPQITNLFIENNIPLPTITKIFQAISKFILRFGLFIVIIIIALFYYLLQYFQTREGRFVLFKFVYDLPIFGILIKNIYASQFLESFYYLIKGGVPLIEALEIVKTSIAHPLYESALEAIIDDVKKGKPLSQSMIRFPDLFPSLIIEGMKTSEKTGQLADITSTIFSFYNETVENQVANIGEAIQPILIVVLGIGLGALETALFVPLLSLTKYIQTF